MIVGLSRSLLGGERNPVADLVDHLADIADALGALRPATGMIEYRLGRAGAGVNGGKRVAFADGVAVADVHWVTKDR